jgi:low affinity Fe/Cu permease
MSMFFARVASAAAHMAGRAGAFFLAVLLIAAWAITGPLFAFSDTWQLIINTGTTVVTFLMVFIIQNTQNRDGAAIQAKLDELIRASAARNVFIGIEHLTESEINDIRSKCEARARTEAAGDEAQSKAQDKADHAAEKAII